MAEEYIIHTPYDTNGSAGEGQSREKKLQEFPYRERVLQHFRPPSLPRPEASTPYGSATLPPQMPFPNIRPASVNGAAQRSPPPHTMPTSMNQQWASSPDRHFRTLFPKPEGFSHSPRDSFPVDSLAGQPSPNPQLPQTPAFKKSPLAKETYVGHLGHLNVSGSHENPIQWHGQTVPRDGRFPHVAPSTDAVAHPAPNRWQQARDYRRKVYEPPYIDPHTDGTLPQVEANAELWVDQLILAMTNTEEVKDTPTSHHRRLFLSESIDPLLIEACCREIFTALIDRCKNGFRGPAHFNKALKANGQLELDRTATCEERIYNVVTVLRWNKRACKDVLYEDWKIRLLVNHPLSYDKEKDSQKGSNDQRRKRQLAEREKMEKTEEELRAYREANGQIPAGGQSNSHFDSLSAYGTGLQSGWLRDKDDGGFSGLDPVLGKRPAFEEPGGNDAKRQRV